MLRTKDCRLIKYLEQLYRLCVKTFQSKFKIKSTSYSGSHCQGSCQSTSGLKERLPAISLLSHYLPANHIHNIHIYILLSEKALKKGRILNDESLCGLIQSGIINCEPFQLWEILWHWHNHHEPIHHDHHHDHHHDRHHDHHHDHHQPHGHASLVDHMLLHLSNPFSPLVVSFKAKWSFNFFFTFL